MEGPAVKYPAAMLLIASSILISLPVGQSRMTLFQGRPDLHIL